MRQARSYDKEFKEQAVKLAKEVGTKKAAEELGIPVGTLSGWNYAAKRGDLGVGKGERTPENTLKLAEEIQQLRAENKTQAKEIARLKELNEFLEEASAFFAARHPKSGKGKG